MTFHYQFVVRCTLVKFILFLLSVLLVNLGNFDFFFSFYPPKAAFQAAAAAGLLPSEKSQSPSPTFTSQMFMYINSTPELSTCWRTYLREKKQLKKKEKKTRKNKNKKTIKFNKIKLTLEKRHHQQCLEADRKD